MTEDELFESDYDAWVAEYYTPTVKQIAEELQAPPGTIWVCGACGKISRNLFGDAEDRWIQARRIYNQHAYSVTNVREDGTLPDEVLNNWEYFNTFRVNSQIDGGVPCKPAG